MDLSKRGSTSSEKGVSSRPPPHLPQILVPSPQPVTEAPEQPKVTAIRETARPKKPDPVYSSP
jgi:hypothetical protein